MAVKALGTLSRQDIRLIAAHAEVDPRTVARIAGGGAAHRATQRAVVHAMRAAGFPRAAIELEQTIEKEGS